jgi:hypothetical protein
VEVQVVADATARAVALTTADRAIRQSSGIEARHVALGDGQDTHRLLDADAHLRLAADWRDDEADERDAEANKRDRSADSRDVHADVRDKAASDQPDLAGTRRFAAQDRHAAAMDRKAAAHERGHSRVDRKASGWDRSVPAQLKARLFERWTPRTS